MQQRQRCHPGEGREDPGAAGQARPQQVLFVVLELTHQQLRQSAHLAQQLQRQAAHAHHQRLEGGHRSHRRQRVVSDESHYGGGEEFQHLLSGATRGVIIAVVIGHLQVEGAGSAQG